MSNEQIRAEFSSKYFEVGCLEKPHRKHLERTGEQCTCPKYLREDVAHARYAGSGAEAVAEVRWKADRPNTMLEIRCIGDGSLSDLGVGTKLYTTPAVPEVTPEMQAAGMTAWDKAHKEGVREWPEMLERVFIAMLKAAQQGKGE